MTQDKDGFGAWVSGRLSRVRPALRLAWEERGRIGCGLVVILLGYLMLRGCVPGLLGNRLPAVLETAVVEAYEHCDQDFPIWPGEVRMPTCDLVTIRSVGAGTVPPDAQALGVRRARCYYVDVEHLFWGESGLWKHEMAWGLRTYSKVAVMRAGEWSLFPDEDSADRARWTEYRCPGDYQSSSGVVPRRS
jgi:hypothetical protein